MNSGSHFTSQEFGSFARQQVSARTVERRLQQFGLSAQRPWLRLPLILHHRSSMVGSTMNTKSETSFLSAESRFFLQYQDGGIHVWWHRVGRTLPACIHHRHTGPSPGMMVWGAIGYTPWLPLLRIDGTLN
ncbi:transposable element Tcb1 transposase [Trichonephila clavipes]|uniref:Transposable element Tcb1 transposase n=1 Tax=Trichonephila clavipes TaxID=2585209 RepID=A0A8X6SZA0_TRICX|nr:transposable element Tcb1 transposase [Trichonephila clavipes]